MSLATCHSRRVTHRGTVGAAQVAIGSSAGIVALCDLNEDAEELVSQRYARFPHLTSIHVNCSDQFMLTSGSASHNSVWMCVVVQTVLVWGWVMLCAVCTQV